MRQIIHWLYHVLHVMMTACCGLYEWSHDEVRPCMLHVHALRLHKRGQSDAVSAFA